MQNLSHHDVLHFHALHFHYHVLHSQRPSTTRDVRSPGVMLTQENLKSRVATNLEKPGNLEYSGNSLNLENLCNSQGILCNLTEKL